MSVHASGSPRCAMQQQQLPACLDTHNTMVHTCVQVAVPNVARGHPASGIVVPHRPPTRHWRGCGGVLGVEQGPANEVPQLSLLLRCKLHVLRCMLCVQLLSVDAFERHIIKASRNVLHTRRHCFPLRRPHRCLARCPLRHPRAQKRPGIPPGGPVRVPRATPPAAAAPR